MSRGQTVVTGNATDFISSIRNELTQIRNDLMAKSSELMGDAMQAGKEVAQERIELSTTPTGDARAARGAGVPGRVDTGDYEDDFDHHNYQLDANHLQGRFGWLEGAIEAHAAGGKSYIELQENGFTAGSGMVSGVHALLEASEIAKGNFKKGLTDYVNEEYK